MTTTPSVKLPCADADGLTASVLLSFLATAGLFYVNIMPALVEGLMSGLGFTARAAGLVGSANVYGAAVGALTAAFLVKHLPWRPVVTVLLAVLMVMDLLSTRLHTPQLLIPLRSAHGLAGGLLVGFAFAVIARTRRPEKTFGMLLIVQFGLGGLGVMFLPRLAAAHGTWVLFMALFAFSAVTAAMVPWLAEYAQPAATRASMLSASLRRRAVPFILALLAVFFFQAANMGLFSFIIGLARHFGLATEFAAKAVGGATWIGISGSVLVIALSVRWGRTLPLMAALALTALGIWALHFSNSPAWFVLANCGTGVTWAFVMPYLLGMCAEFDEGGQAAAFAGFASKMGLASGPMAGALLLGSDRYELLINLATLGIVVCAALALVPVRLLDRGRVPQRHADLAAGTGAPPSTAIEQSKSLQ